MKGLKYSLLLGSAPAIAGLMEKCLKEQQVGRKREFVRELCRELIEAYAPFVPGMPQVEELLPIVDDVFDACAGAGILRRTP